MHVLTSQYRTLARIGYSWDGAFLYATADDRTRDWNGRRLECWELGGDTAARDVPDSPVGAYSFLALPDGKVIVAGHRAKGDEDLLGTPTYLVVDPEGWEDSFDAPDASPDEIAISPRGDRFITSHYLPGFGQNTLFRAYRIPLERSLVAEWEEPVQFVHGGWLVSSIAHLFHPLGEQFLSVEETGTLGRAYEWALRWRSATTGEPLGEPIPFEVEDGSALKPRFADGGRRLVNCYSNEITTFDLSDLATEPTKVKRRSHFTDLAVHPDGKRVFASSNDGTVREYDAVTLQELRAYEWKVGKLLCVAVAPDGLTAAVGSDTGKVVVWDLE